MIEEKLVPEEPTYQLLLSILIDIKEYEFADHVYRYGFQKKKLPYGSENSTSYSKLFFFNF